MVLGTNHFDSEGRAVMVDVSQKDETERSATACGRISLNEAAFNAVLQGNAKKGDVLGVARIAGIMAVKRTSELIPLCHSLALEQAAIEFTHDEAKREIEARCTVSSRGRTGVEMEALTGVSIAMLTVYDMCKSLDREMVISGVKLLEKRGGASGEYIREGE